MSFCEMTESDEDAAAAEDDPEVAGAVLLSPRTKKRRSQRVYAERKRQKRLEMQEKAEMYDGLLEDYKQALADQERDLDNIKELLVSLKPCLNHRLTMLLQVMLKENQVSQKFV